MDDPAAPLDLAFGLVVLLVIGLSDDPASTALTAILAFAGFLGFQYFALASDLPHVWRDFETPPSDGDDDVASVFD